MHIIDEKLVDTVAYGKIRFIKTEKGWTYQYDRVLLDGWEAALKSSADGITPFYLLKDAQPAGEYVPEDSEIESEVSIVNWYDSFEEAHAAGLCDLSNARIMGTLAVWA